jgi:K+-sensing histidine kinase KdpD
MLGRDRRQPLRPLCAPGATSICRSARPALVRIKAAAVSRVASNLIDNARAYGRAPLDVTTTRHGDAVVVDVAARGPGIAPGDSGRMIADFAMVSPQEP